MSEGHGPDPLHVPDAPHRPGDEAGFVDWPWSPEDLKRPDVDCDASETAVTYTHLTLPTKRIV